VLIRIRSVLVATVAPLGPRGVPSGINKQPVAGAVDVRREGLAGDEQGDRKHHGGPEKAIHHYAFEHYARWRQDDPGLAWRLDGEGAFGENLSTEGMTEADVCLGDIYRLGTALVQVSQGRQPCWRLNERFRNPNMARRLQESGRTGWYYRVLEEGTVSRGAEVLLVERPRPDWPLARTAHLLYRRTLDFDALSALSEIPELSSSWRELARRRTERRMVEDWSRRLHTPQ
jgi:MOSC domain-containing protein YiiM